MISKLKSSLLISLTSILFYPSVGSTNERQDLLDKARFIGFGATINCLLNIDRINSEQAQYILVNQLKKDNLEYLKDWGRGPEATKSILKLSKVMPSDCNPNLIDKEKFNKIVSEEMDNWE